MSDRDIDLICKTCFETKKKRKRKARYVLTKLNDATQPILIKTTIPLCADCARHARNFIERFPDIMDEVDRELREKKKVVSDA